MSNTGAFQNRSSGSEGTLGRFIAWIVSPMLGKKKASDSVHRRPSKDVWKLR